jgi:hypothetical protein
MKQSIKWINKKLSFSIYRHYFVHLCFYLVKYAKQIDYQLLLISQIGLKIGWDYYFSHYLQPIKSLLIFTEFSVENCTNVIIIIILLGERIIKLIKLIISSDLKKTLNVIKLVSFILIS